MNNPYDAPAADLSHPGEPACQPAFFALRGRLGRVRYVAYLMGVTLLVMLVLFAIATLFLVVFPKSQWAMFLPLLMTVTAMGCSLIVVVRRLNDMNRSGWWALLTLVPIVNLGGGLWLLVGPGDKGANNYGSPPCANTTGVTVACVGAVAAVVIVMLMVGSSAFFFHKMNDARYFRDVPGFQPQSR